MLFNLNSNNNCHLSKKRFILTLLLIHTFLGCIYYIYEQKEQEINSNRISTIKWNNSFNEQENFVKTNHAIKFIKTKLENEYNENDLKNFYDLVEKEYSLGLKCTRKQNLLQRIILSNFTNQLKKTNRKRKTKFSLSLSNSIYSSHRLYQHKNLYTYKITNSNACLNESIDLLIIIISKSDNYKTRDAIRRTWGSGRNLGIYSTINIKFFFLIDFDEKLSENIRLENNLFNDIIQVELPEQYTLVTHRVLSLIEWSFRYCYYGKFLFKTDDDIFINLILLLKFLLPLINQKFNDKKDSFLISDMIIYGYKHINSIVFRYSINSVQSRYIVTNDEYPCTNYPTYLSGFGYLISKKTRDAILYTAYQDPEPFRLSDVYITGIIPDYLSISLQSMSNYLIRFEGDCEHFFNQSNAFACAIDAHHGNKIDVFQKFNHYWQIIKKKHRLIF